MKHTKPTDRHHLLWYRKNYSKGWAKRLRDHWYCSVEIPRDTLHKEIHHKIAHIPVPRVISIKSALEQLNLLEKFGGISKDDNIEKRLQVLLALFDCAEPSTHAALKAQYDIVCKFYHHSPR